MEVLLHKIYTKQIRLQLIVNSIGELNITIEMHFEHNNRNALPQKYKNTFQGRDMTAYMAGQGEARDKCVHEWSGRVGH